MIGGNTMNDFFFIQNYVDNIFKSNKQIDHEIISNEFKILLRQDFDDNRFSNLLKHSGYIPDLYNNDSSEEVLYTKLVEVLVAEWAERMGFKSEIVKQKASKEDVTINIDNKIIVCDAKSFRLGRSQKAPNVKDFLKLEDIRKWMESYEGSIGGLVTYPCTHEWKNTSDAYRYCSTKDAPTLMLPYKYLAFLFDTRHKYDTNNLVYLWDYEKLFPNMLDRNIKGGNKTPYWNTINTKILEITNSTQEDFKSYMDNANKLIISCINENLKKLNIAKREIIDNINANIQSETDISKIKNELINYKTKTETALIDKIIKRIKGFRL